VWWLVAPQNPLKDPREYAAYAERLEQVAGIAKHPRFIVSDLENRWGTETTAELLDRLSVARQQARFVWIMGADSFATLHEWHHWTDIAESIPLAFLARPGYSIRALDSRAALRYATRRVAIEDARTLPFRQPPAWTFIPMPLRTESSTEIRRSRRGLTKSPEPERAASS
jgi:nicotinate-nucleotide adenylyltransferase